MPVIWKNEVIRSSDFVLLTVDLNRACHVHKDVI